MGKIELDNVTFVYGAKTPFETVALDGVSYSFEANKITGIIGHTGSGKSSLVQLLNGIEKPASGRVLFDGNDIWKEKKPIPGLCFKVGLVMQYPEYQLFDETVEKDISYGPKNMKLPDAEIKERVAEAMDFVGLDKAFAQSSPFDLSGGQKRRTAIAGVMAMRPEVLVLDEPAAGLDPSGRRTIFNGIKRYAEARNATVIIVSHSMDDMAVYCDNLLVLSNGKKLLSGSVPEVFSHGKELIETGLDVPGITKLMLELAQRGLPVDTGIYTAETAEKQLLTVLGENNK